MKPTEIITAARRITNDRDPASYRTSDAEMLEYVNDFSKAVARAKPGLVTGIITVAMVPGEFQSVPRDTTNGLMRPLKRVGGVYLSPISYESLVRQFRSFSTSDGPPTEWAPLDGDPFGFVVYPRSVGGEQVLCLVSAIPQDVGLGDDMPIGDSYRAAGANYVAGRVLLKNTNVADAQRAAALMSAASSLAGIQSMG